VSDRMSIDQYRQHVSQSSVNRSGRVVAVDPMKTRVAAFNEAVKAEKPKKYRNKKIEVDGIIFDSTAESRRYIELKFLMETGAITNLRLQPTFEIAINGVKVCKYSADFEYTRNDGQRVVEDVKGFKTPVYNLKKRLLRAVHGVVITEIR
jgi:Protein of unknown function (DUF1064)